MTLSLGYGLSLSHPPSESPALVNPSEITSSPSSSSLCRYFCFWICLKKMGTHQAETRGMPGPQPAPSPASSTASQEESG